jgi:hypothetical protein
MVVESGQMPYQYDVPTPLSASTAVGLSGVHLESAQFVINAELRKFFLFSNSLTSAWRAYSNPDIAGIAYEPKADGSTLAGDVLGPVQVDLDHIPLMRAIMIDGLFEFYEDFSPYDSEDIVRDWVQQAYPTSPSGYNPVRRGIFFRPVLQADGGTYFPTIFGPDGQTGTFTDPDPHWLGGSGVIMDIDVGEVMFNPYPIAVNTGIGNAHEGNTDTWRVLSRPLWPSFQRTDGTLISLNGEENRWPENLPDSSAIVQTDSIGSGYVLYQGYPVLPETEFVLGRMNDPEGDVQGLSGSSNEFTYIIQTGNSLGDALNLEHSAVFVDPPVLPTGLYRTTMRNTKANVPFTTVESGTISQWPDPSPVIGSAYEVFDSCFWVTDVGNKFITGAGSGPSGLAVISPFTGKSLWLRNAVHDSAGTYRGGADSIETAYWDEGLNSLQRVGTNDIKRICRTPIDRTAAGAGFVDLDVNVATFNDDISTVAITGITLTVPSMAVTFTANIVIRHMIFDGTSYHVLVKDTFFAEPFVIVTLDNAFVQTATSIASTTSDNLFKLGYISDGKGGSQTLVTYQLLGSSTPLSDQLGIVPVTLGNPPTYGTEKIIDITTHIGGTITSSHLYELLEISGETEVDDGVYALVSIDTSTTANTLYILRIEEETASWSIQGLWNITTVDNNYNATFHQMGMIYKSVD